MIFCGDLNVAHTELDLANPETESRQEGLHRRGARGLPEFLDAGFIDTFRLFKKGNGHYSWWSNFTNARARNVGWRIDYVVVSGALRGSVKRAQIHAEVLGSDHCPVSITLA